MSVNSHKRPMDCREHILRGLTHAMMKRNSRDDDWIERERMAVAVAANEWAMANGCCTVTVDDIERIEVAAVGHVDYARKLALYVAEFVVAS